LSQSKVLQKLLPEVQSQWQNWGKHLRKGTMPVTQMNAMFSQGQQDSFEREVLQLAHTADGTVGEEKLEKTPEWLTQTITYMHAFELAVQIRNLAPLWLVERLRKMLDPLFSTPEKSDLLLKDFRAVFQELDIKFDSGLTLANVAKLMAPINDVRWHAFT
jgi:hypothetical protein